MAGTNLCACRIRAWLEEEEDAGPTVSEREREASESERGSVVRAIVLWRWRGAQVEVARGSGATAGPGG